MNKNWTLWAYVVCVAGASWAQDSSNWQGGDGSWSDSTNWDNGVPSVSNNATYTRPAIKTTGTVTVDIPLIGGDAISGFYQQTKSGGNTFEITELGMDVQGSISLALGNSGTSDFNFTANNSWKNLSVSGDVALGIPAYGKYGDATFSVQKPRAAAHILGEIRILNNGRLADQIRNSSQTVSTYQSSAIYVHDGLQINCESGIGGGGVSVTNTGVLSFRAWNEKHYGTITVGQAQDGSGSMLTNLDATIELTDGAVLDVNVAKYEPTSDFSHTLIHMVSTNEWNGSFEQIIVTGDEVSLGGWTSQDLYGNGDTELVWYYQVEMQALDGDGFENDLVLNVTTNEPPPEPAHLSIAFDGTHLVVSSQDLSPAASNVLQMAASPVSPVWSNVPPYSTGTGSAEWSVPPAAAGCFRILSY